MIPLLFALLTTGFGFMVLEILILRELLVTLGGTIYASSAVLASVMLGLFLGSQLFGWIVTVQRDWTRLLVAMEFALCLAAAILVPALRWTGTIDRWELRYALAFLIILPPSVLAGGEIPVAMQYAERFIARGRTGFYAGLVYGADTMGALLGALALPFCLLPELGAYRSSLVAALAQLLGGLALLVSRDRGKRGLSSKIGAVLSAAVMAVGLLRADRIEALTAPWSIGMHDSHPGDGTLFSFVRESPYQRIQIIGRSTQPGRPPPNPILFLDGASQSSAKQPPMFQESILFALLAHPNPEDVLVIGCGDGDLVRSALADPRVKRLEQAELDPAVVEVSSRYLPGINHLQNGTSIWRDPRVRLSFGDGRRRLEESRRLYDVIFTDLPHAASEGASPFYTVDFMQLVRKRLKPGGVFATHVLWPERDPRAFLTEMAAMLIALRTARKAFGENARLLSYRLWPEKTKNGDWGAEHLILASLGPLQAGETQVRGRWGVFSPRPVWLTPERFMRWMKNARLPESLDELPVSTHDRPAILYASRLRQTKAVRVLASYDP